MSAQDEGDRQQQGVCVYYQIASSFVFDLCELVCDSLLTQIQQQFEKCLTWGLFARFSR